MKTLIAVAGVGGIAAAALLMLGRQEPPTELSRNPSSQAPAVVASPTPESVPQKRTTHPSRGSKGISNWIQEINPRFQGELPIDGPAVSFDEGPVFDRITVSQHWEGVPLFPPSAVTVLISKDDRMLDVQSNWRSSKLRSKVSGQFQADLPGKRVLWVDGEQVRRAHETWAGGIQTVIDGETREILFQRDRRIHERPEAVDG